MMLFLEHSMGAYKMEINELLSQLQKLTEQELILDLPKYKEILNANYIDYDIEEDEKLRENTYETTYNKYKYYSTLYETHCVMLRGDFKNLCKDLCDMLENCLTDGFEQFFDEDGLYNAMLKDSYYIVQTINMINRFNPDADLYNFENIDTVEVDGIEYVIFEEK